MNDATDLQIDWGSLGETWWREAGAQTRASELQIKFSACRFAGMNRTAAAMAAGYTHDKERARKSGSEAAMSSGVQTLMTLARAEAAAGDGPKAPKALLTKIEIEQKLSDLVRTADPTTAMRAAESLMKLRGPDQESSFFNNDDGFGEWRIVRDYLRMPLGASAVVLLLTGAGTELAGFPLLHDVAARVKREDAGLWQRIVKQQSTVGRVVLDRHLSDPDWQREARTKIWLEVGVSIDDLDAGNSKDAAKPASAQTTQAVVDGLLDGHLQGAPERADARG